MYRSSSSGRRLISALRHECEKRGERWRELTGEHSKCSVRWSSGEIVLGRHSRLLRQSKWTWQLQRSRLSSPSPSGHAKAFHIVKRLDNASCGRWVSAQSLSFKAHALKYQLIRWHGEQTVRANEGGRRSAMEKNDYHGKEFRAARTKGTYLTLIHDSENITSRLTSLMQHPARCIKHSFENES